MMQRPNYWPRNSYNPRDGSWVQSWYGTPYSEAKDVRNATYENSFFHKNHMQRTDSEYYSSPDIQIVAEKRNTNSFPNPASAPVHHSPLSESVSPSSSFSEPSFRLTSPRHHFVSVPRSPQSQCVDVSSPVSYHSDEASPRLSQSSPPRSRKYYDKTTSSNSYNDYNSLPSRMVQSPRPNSCLTTQQFYKIAHREVHPKDVTQVTESADHNRSYITSSRNNRTFNNSSFKRYETKGWSSYRSHRQSSFPPKRNIFSSPNHVSYADKPHLHKPRPSGIDKPEIGRPVLSPARPNNASGNTASSNVDKNVASVNATKAVALAPPTEKSITNLISKLFKQDPTVKNSVTNNHTHEKSLKSSGGSSASAVGEIRPKNKGSPSTTALNSKQKGQGPARMGYKSQQNFVDAQNKLGSHVKNSILKGNSPSPTKLLSDKVENVKKNCVLKPLPKNSQSRSSPGTPRMQSNSSSIDSESRDKQIACRVNTSPNNNVNSDLAFVARKLCEDENKKKGVTPPLKNLRARISIVSGNKVLPKDSSTFPSPNSSEHISPNSSENLRDRFNGMIKFCPKGTPSKTLKARKSGWENRSRSIRASEDKSLCNGDVGTQEDFEPKARKSFRPQIPSPLSSSVVTEHMDPNMKTVTCKKKKRRHFRGGRYDLCLKPKKKKDKKCMEKRTSEGSAGGDSSDASEKDDDIFVLDNFNSGNLFAASSTSEPVPPTNKSGAKMQVSNKPFADISTVLKLPLTEVLWSRLDRDESVSPADNVKLHTDAVLQQSISGKDLSKSMKSLSGSDYAKTAFEKVCGVARKSQVSYRQPSRTRSADPPFVKSSTDVTSLKSSVNQDSDIEIVGFVENVPQDAVSNSRLPTAVSTAQGGKNSVSLAGFSSDSDDEVLIKKRKRGSFETCGNAMNVEKKTSFLSDRGTESFYTKDVKLPKSLCTCLARSLCDSNTQFPEEMLICQAVDSIDGELVTCKNRLAKSNLVRPSLKIPYVAMCESHLSRLRQHQCCPNCGFFCTQGVFLQCVTMDPKTKEHHFHFLHHTCQVPVANGGPPTCPHCGNYSKFKTVTLKRSVEAPCVPSFISPVDDDKGSEQEITKEQSKEDSSDSYLEEPDDNFISGNSQSYVPDELQLKSMAESLATEKTISLRPSGKSFYAPVRSGDLDKVLQLLAMGVDPNHKFEHHNNDTSLHVAAEAGFPLLVHSLIQAGACINLVNNNLYTPIMLAVEKKNISVVRCLLTSGAQLNIKSEEGMTCLHLAACGGNILLCKMILESSHLKINVQDDGGWTPLVWAAEHKHSAVAKLLLDRGADANVVDKEKNVALHWAAFSGCTDVAQLLLDWGCCVDVFNEHGDTPLHIAAREDNYECVVLFLARGAATSAKNEADQTPIMCCKSNSCSSWMALSMHNELQKWKGGKVKCERVVYTDISRGREEDPIQVINGVDDEEAPSDFHYITESCEASDISIDTNVSSLHICHCKGNCSSNECTCALMSFQCWYDKNGCLLSQFDMSEPPIIFECNKLCLCWKTCRNRLVQFGITCRLQIFRTQGKGWGVRTLKNIPKGTFICEYVGEIITDLDADHRDDDSYLFDLDSRDSDTFCLDARYYGNVSRFINHLCDANLIPVKIFVDHHDLKFPRIAFFSSRDIQAFEELGFDYGEKFWLIKSKWFHCECGSPLCRYPKGIDKTENSGSQEESETKPS